MWYFSPPWAGYSETLNQDIDIVVPDDDYGLYAIDILDPAWVSCIRFWSYLVLVLIFTFRRWFSWLSVNINTLLHCPLVDFGGGKRCNLRMKHYCYFLFHFCFCYTSLFKLYVLAGWDSKGSIFFCVEIIGMNQEYLKHFFICCDAKRSFFWLEF